MNKILTIIIFQFTRFFPRQTLLSKSWYNIKSYTPEVYKLRRERRIYLLKSGINRSGTAVFLMSILLGLISASCLFSWDFTDTQLDFLNFIKLDNPSAKQLIADSLMATATISALSFVVINFLFDKVKNATHETYQTLFRATALYYFLSFVLIGFVVLVVLNLLKHTPEEETLVNMALWSGYLSISIVLAIIWLFFRVLRFLNPQNVVLLSRGYLLNAAKFHRLDERLIEECNKELFDIFESRGYTKETPFLYQPGIESDFISFRNHDYGVMYDLHLPIVNHILNTLDKKIAGGTSYFPIQYTEPIYRNHTFLALSEKFALQKFNLWILSFAIWVKPDKTTSVTLATEKKKMQEELVRSASKGDIDSLKQQFSNIEDMYKIYYETK